MQVNQIIDDILNSMLNSEDGQFRLASQHAILEVLERDELLVLERQWPGKRVNMVEFIKIMIGIVHHKSGELLYLVMGLIELFKDMVAASQESELALSDVTSFVCQNEGPSSMVVQQQAVPEPKKFQLNKDRIRQIDVEAPRVLGLSEEEICHVVPNQLVTDSMRHHNGIVQNAIYCNKQIVTLDSLDSKINIYHLDGTLKRHVTVAQAQDERETIVLAFAWSDRQQRLGLALKSHQLCFYESDFITHRTFQTVLASQDYQTCIWFMENQTKWITTDASFKLYEWDLQSEAVTHVYQSSKLNGSVIECVEVLHMKMFATASLDKQILVWDLNTKDVKIVISLKDQGGVHSLIYSYQYQVFISCGYSTNINIYEINPKFHDVSIVGKLTGHTSMLTALQMIGKSPVLVSGDDTGSMRLWDIRTFSCLQQINFGKRTLIGKILDLSFNKQIAFIGSRLNFLKLDMRQKDLIENYAVRIEFDQQRDQFLVASKKHILTIDAHTGRVKSILNGLLNDIEDEITQYRPLNYFNKFILGDQRGSLKIFQHNGEYLSSLRGHHDVLCLRLDILNKLIVSSGPDEIIIQKMNGEVLREISPLKSVAIELSVHHSLILSHYQRTLTILDYEFAKILSIYEFEAEITSVLFIANYPVFVVSIQTGKVLIMSFKVREHTSVECSVLGVYESASDYMTEEADQDFVHKLHLSVKDLELLMATNEGNVIRIQLELSMETTEPVHERINYNPTRKFKELLLFPEPIIVQTPNSTLKHITLFHASKKLIMSIGFIQLDTRLILLAAIDGSVKIFDLIGHVIAALNINHPLPLKWDLKYTKQHELRKRIVYGFKVIDILRKQAKTEKEAEFYSLTESIQQLSRSTSLKVNKQANVILMRDEYEPRDLQFDKIRHMYQHEIQGPSLKQMEAQRRVLEVQNMFKNDNRDPKLELLIKQKEKEKQKALDRAAYLNYLDPDYKDKYDKKPIYTNDHLKEFARQLDQSDVNTTKHQMQPSFAQSKETRAISMKKKKKSVSDFYQYAAQKQLLGDPGSSFSSMSTFKPTYFSRNPNQVSQIQSVISIGHHSNMRRQQKDLSSVLSSLNLKVKASKNSMPQNILKDLSMTVYEDQLDEFSKKYK